MTTALEGGEFSAARPGRTLPPGKTRYPFYRRLGGPQGRFRQVRKNLVHTGIRSRTFHPVAQSLYRLNYRPTLYTLTFYIYCLTLLKFVITHLRKLLWCVDNRNSWNGTRRGFIQDQIELNCTCEVLKAVCELRRGRHAFDLPSLKAVLCCVALCCVVLCCVVLCCAVLCCVVLCCVVLCCVVLCCVVLCCVM